jgi:hypothetical protein
VKNPEQQPAVRMISGAINVPPQTCRVSSMREAAQGYPFVSLTFQNGGPKNLLKPADELRR